MRLIAAFAGALALLGAAAPVFAQGQCAALCAVSCVKPISIPDRWDDVTPIPGYAGEIVGRTPNWRNNSSWDSETISNDVNGNGLYDPGDGFEDGNRNGTYDAEAYDPLTTGYSPGPTSLVPSGDLGMELVLHPDNDFKATPGQYQPIALPAVNRGTPIVNDSGVYMDNWTTCNPTLLGSGDICQLQPGILTGPTNQIMRATFAEDAGAYWDPITSSVQGSQFPVSPRVIFLAIHDPRIPSGLSGKIVIRGIAAVFMEQMEGNAEVRGRFMRALGTGEPCVTGGAGFVVECPTPARSTSWGQVKNLYR